TGRNELGGSTTSWWAVLLRQVRSPLLGLLAVAAALSIGLGEQVDGFIILAIMGLSVGLGFLNEFRSERTLATLQARAGRRAGVVRSGGLRDIAVAELVPGGLVRLGVGTIVPADLRLTEARDLAIDEATLTGEPYPSRSGPSPGSRKPDRPSRPAPT